MLVRTSPALRRRSARLLARGAVLGLVAALSAPAPARAWYFREHEEIGSLGYVQACRRLQTEFREKEVSPDRLARLALACQNVDVSALLYGKANGTAGDRISDPQEFLSSVGAFRATSRLHYLRLKMVNSTHFHPKAPHEWRQYHQRALQRAVEAAKKDGLDQVDALELAVNENAFADHFLQDSFCAGHMGFNRPASSAAATLVFHSTWNARGRAVRNREGESWRTYGDGFLNAPENAEGRRHVIEATALSVYSVLLAFVEGRRHPEHELAIWRALPFTIEAPQVRTPVESLLSELADRPIGTGLEPLGAINQPALHATSFDTRTVATNTFARGRPLVGLLAGFTTSVPFLRPLVYGAIGGSIAPDEDLPRLTTELGVVRPLFLSKDGVLSHDAVAGVVWQAGLKDFRGSLQANYRVNLELGRFLVRLQVGPALLYPERRFGFHAGLGLSYLLTAKGGGSI